MPRARPRVPVATASSPEPTPESLGAWLGALANPRRIRLLQFLVVPRTVEEMAAELRIARQNAQQHLQQLQRIGAVQRLEGSRGPAARWVVAPARLFAIQDALGSLGALEPQLSLEAIPPTSAMATQGAAPKERDLPRLVVVRGMRIGRTEALAGPGPWLIGRATHATVGLDYDPYVSARHAEVRRAAQGFEVADLYSSNGTWVDWERLPRGGARPLANGQVVRAGKTILLFRAPS